MKVRTDFVTNSSSVSYVIFMNLDIVDCFLRMEEEYNKNKEYPFISRKLREFMLEHGTVSYLENHEIYTYLMEFQDDDGSAMNKEMLKENGMNTDVTTMTETELFNYLRGEYLMGRKMNRLVSGLSAIQVEQY